MVEDEYFIAVDVVERLEAAGAAVIGPVATTGEALSLIETERLDGAILDLNLDGDMSFQVADALQARAIPFVLATGYGRERIPTRFAGVALCKKQIDPMQIASALFHQAGRGRLDP